MPDPSDFVPVVDYTSRDYLGFRQSMIDLIPQYLPEWTSRAEGDFGMVLLELFAYVGDNLSYYGDRIANEAFIDTAVERGSVLAIAEMLDYTPSGLVPAVTLLQFTVANGSPPTVIPAGTKVATISSPGTSPIVFETDAAITIPADTATPVYTRTVPATEGTTYTQETLGVSAGVIDQTFSLFHSPVIQDSIHVYIDELSGGFLEWVFFDHLIDADPNDRAYTVQFTDENVALVVFGDGVNGKIPAPGATITSTYRTGAGVDGNVGANALTQIVTTIGNVISVTNPNNAVGGSDVETIDQIRRAAPRALTTAGRAVSALDYATLALRVAGVAKAAATASTYANVTLYIAQVGGVPPSDFLKERVQTFLNDKKMVGVSVTIADPTFVGLRVVAQVSPLPEYDPESVRAAVQKAIVNLLSFNKVDFGFRVSLSSIYRAIHATPGVDYAFVSRLVRADAITTVDTKVTTIAAASNNATLPQAVITVDSTVGFPTTGGTLKIPSLTTKTTQGGSFPITNQTISVASTSGFAASGTVYFYATTRGTVAVTYTSKDATHFIGCNSPTDPTIIGQAYANGTQVQSSTSVEQTITYGAVTPTTFTGCTGGSGVISTGGTVTLFVSPVDFQFVVADGSEFPYIATDATVDGAHGYQVIVEDEVMFVNRHTVTNPQSIYAYRGGPSRSDPNTPLPAFSVDIPSTAFVIGPRVTHGPGAEVIYSRSPKPAPSSAPSTTIATLISALPTATITVASTARFPSSGTIYVTSSTGVQTITYTGVTATTFTGCAGGGGAVAVGNSVTGVPIFQTDDLTLRDVFYGPYEIPVLSTAGGVNGLVTVWLPEESGYIG